MCKIWSANPYEGNMILIGEQSTLFNYEHYLINQRNLNIWISLKKIRVIYLSVERKLTNNRKLMALKQLEGLNRLCWPTVEKLLTNHRNITRFHHLTNYDGGTVFDTYNQLWFGWWVQIYFNPILGCDLRSQLINIFHGVETTTQSWDAFFQVIHIGET